MRLRWIGLVVGVMAVALGGLTNGDEPDAGNSSAESATAKRGEKVARVSYSRDIEPIFRARCQGCHQPAKASGGFVLTSYEELTQPGDSGESPIVPASPEQSYLWQQIKVEDGQSAMPPDGPPLSPAEIELVRMWIVQGATNDSPPTLRRFDEKHPPQYSRPPVITAICFSPDGKWLAVSGFHEVLLVATDTWETRHRLIGLSERIESVAFSPDSRRLAVTGGSPGRMGEVQIWDVDSVKLLLSKQVAHDTIYGGQFSPDGRLVAFGCPDNTVRAIEAETGEQVLHQGAHDDWVLACAFNPDGTHLVSAGRDMTVKLTEVATERFIDNITSITPGALRGGINALAMHPSRNEVLVGGADGIPKVYRLFRETQRRIGDDANLIRKFPELPGRIFDVDISSNGELLAAAATLDGVSRVAIYPYAFTGDVPEDVKKAMAKRVSDRNEKEKKLITEFRSRVPDPEAIVELPSDSVYSVAFAPDAGILAIGGSSGIVRLLDRSTQWQVVREFVPVELADGDEVETSNGKQDLPMFGNGLPLTSQDLPGQSREQELLPRKKLVALEVYPATVHFKSLREYVQLVVEARFSDGTRADVTRVCQVRGGDSVVECSPLGLIRPVAAGTCTLHVAFDSIRKEIAVRVEAGTDASIDFVRDVNPILSRLGCNAGTCHGAQKGKNGFKLSLRGYDPVEDVRALSDDLAMRRLHTAQPDASLMLMKPTGAVPHEGGVLMTPESSYYHILRSWIAGGAVLKQDSTRPVRLEVFPQDPVLERVGSWQQFRVVAVYGDGEQRDVTHEAFLESGNTEVAESHVGGRVEALRRGEAAILVRYEGAYAASTLTVMGDRSGFAWEDPPVFNRIDELVAEKWKRMKILPSPICSDAEFLRRVRLDLTGLPPTVEELREFLADDRSTRIKRQEKIEQLLGSTDYVEYWTNKWADLLQVNSKYLGKDGAVAFRQWIREAVAENRPYDEFVREILTASGSNKDNPAASYFKILRSPDVMMENTTHLFLGVRFNCNKCHDHPFERWTQDQYYQLGAFFARTALKKDPASGDRKIGGTAVEGPKPLYEIVYDRPDGEMTHPRSGEVVAPGFPFDCKYEVAEQSNRREELAAWLTSADNPYFAKSYVNRLWGYLTGTGLIEPLDDIRAGNPPSNPELLDYLTQEFIDSGFDVKHVLRLICNSRVYQLSVEANEWNTEDNRNYSHAKARRLPAEALYDAIHLVVGSVPTIPGTPAGTRAAALADAAVDLPDGFLKNFGRPPRESACECERSDDLQLGPVMALISGPTVGRALSDSRSELAQLAKSNLNDRDLIREVYLRIICREPTEEEIESVLAIGQQIEKDHVELVRQLKEREAWWEKERARREQLRKEKLAEVRRAITRREKEIAPEREKLEAERAARIQQAKEELEKYQQQGAEIADRYLQKAADVEWIPLAPFAATSSSKDTLQFQPDRSLVASGQGDKAVYDVKYRTSLCGLTGFRLEALPVESLPGGGPGLPPNGNFVLTEVEVFVYPESAPQSRRKLKIATAAADFSQQGFSPQQAIDGKADDQGGWAVHPQGGLVHWMTLTLAEPLDISEPVLIEFRLHQNHNAAKHRLARFRISATCQTVQDSAKGLPPGLPEAFSAVKHTAKEARTNEQLKSLLAYLEQNDDRWLELKQALKDAEKPLPPDEQLVALKAEAKALEAETPEDVLLRQLRDDVATSQQQLENRRLTMVQDLAWALINTPAFLFNH